VTGYRAALPGHAGPGGNHNSQPGDAQIAGLAEVLGSDALAADQAARRQAGAQLLRNPDISASAAAREPLADGSVDSRLLVTLAVLAGLRPSHPLRRKRNT
jgi:hypothetical protein